MLIILPVADRNDLSPVPGGKRPSHVDVGRGKGCPRSLPGAGQLSTVADRHVEEARSPPNLFPYKSIEQSVKLRHFLFVIGNEGRAS